MNITVNAKTLQAVFNDSKSNQDLIDFLNSVIDEELAKTNPDCDLIDECVDLIDELQEHKYTSPVLRVVLSANTVKKIVNPKRNSWKSLNRALRVAIIAAMIATGTFTVNAAVKSATGIDFIGNITSAISSFIHNDKKGELTTEVYVPVDKTATAATTTTQIFEESTTKVNVGNTETEKFVTTTSNTTEAEAKTEHHTSKIIAANKKEVNKTEEREEPTDPYADTDSPQLVGIRAEFEHFKTAYIYGEKLSYDGLKIFAKYSDKTEKSVSLDDCAYSKNLDMEVTADYTLSITYKACTVNVNITVRPDENTRISDICSNADWDYLLTDKGAYISSYNGNDTDLTVNAIDGKSALAVTSRAFENSKVVSFSSDSVKAVYQSAFENAEKLKICNVPNVVSIGNNAFKDSALQSINFSDDLTELGTAAFENTNLRTLTVPNAVATVPERLCNNCSSLRVVNLAGKVDTVDDMAFNKCSKLTKLNGAGNIKNVGFYAFAEDELMKFDTAPQIENAADGAFAYCYNANFGDVGTSFKSLGERSFDNCEGITSVTIPSNIKTVPAYCFNGVDMQEVIIENGVMRIEQGAFKSVDSQEVTIPESVEYIGEYAFYSTNLRTITVKSKTAEICDNAFYLGSRVTLNVTENSTAYDLAVKNDVKYNLIQG
ncbi:MAG: leucine-rich repeat protein [Clostridia bacterium]|nr:leucine-rich repeat protein [Clostridia bacterium]